MPPKFQNKSLAVETLIKMGIRISVVVCIVTSFAYLHLRHTLREEAESQIQSYSTQRIARERLPFELAQQYGERFRRDYLRRLESPAPADVDARFAKIAHPWGDGTLRNLKEGFDPHTMVGLFVGPQQTIDATFKRRVVLSADMIDVLGSELTSTFPDFYLTMPANVMVIYWPDVAWTNDMAPDFDMRKEPYFTVASHATNPKGEQRWTSIYYDAVGKVWMMSFATPIYVGAEHVGSIEQDILLDAFLTRTATQSLTGASNVIVREDGTLIYARGYDEKIVKADGALQVKDASDPWLAGIFGAATEAGHEIRVVEQGDDLVGLGFIPGPNWYFATVYPKALISSRALAAARGILGLGVLSLIAELSVLFFVLRRQVAHPLKSLTEGTAAVASGNLDVRIDMDRDDELGRLATSFNAMTDAVRKRDGQLADHAATLEATVARRTEQLDSRNREMRTVMDHVEEGLVTLDRDGTMGAESSAALADWFGGARPGLPFVDYVQVHDPTFAAHFHAGFEAVLENFLPLELTVDQLPKTVHLGDHTVRVHYLPILEDGELAQMLVVMKDVTAEIARVRVETDQREFVQIIDSFGRDRQGFADFFEEANKIVEHLTVDPVRDASLDARLIHTLKGNAGLVGLNGVAELCHELEDAMADAGELVDSQRKILADRWASVTSKFRSLVGGRRNGFVEIARSKMADLVISLRSPVPDRSLAELVESWSLDPVEARLARLGDYAVALAARVGKPSLKVSVKASGIFVDGEAWAPIWAATVHLVRNAVDHGIEAPQVRVEANKPEFGTLDFGARVEGGSFILSLADDGAGIDWDAVRARALRLGVPSRTREQLERALFVDGLSTRDTVSHTSGRGVGLSALKLEIERLGGQIRVSSERGVGCRWEFHFSASAMTPVRSTVTPATISRAVARLHAGV